MLNLPTSILHFVPGPCLLNAISHPEIMCDQFMGKAVSVEAEKQSPNADEPFLPRGSPPWLPTTGGENTLFINMVKALGEI